MGSITKPAKRSERLQVMLDDEELTSIDDWRFSNRIPTRAAAIRELIRRGMLYQDTVDGSVEEQISRDKKSSDFRAVPTNSSGII